MTVTHSQRASLYRASIVSCWGAMVITLLATIALGVEPMRTDKEIKEPGNPPLRNPPTQSPELTEVRIWNVANQPFRFRLARSNGLRWTDEIVVQPGKYQGIRVPKRGQPSELEGLTINSDSSYEARFIGVRYPKYGGFIEVNLPIERGEQAIPNWFHVLDPNGFSDLIQAPSVEEAREGQADLLKQKPLTPQQIERIKTTLRANWEFYDR